MDEGTGTTARALRMLSLLQSRPTWTGRELAERTGVTERTVRRDVDRLRTLGYPVEADHGRDGGYRLGAGRALPPLLLDDDEAVAVAVCLHLGAVGVSGVGEAALRTLTKIDQVLPARLRSEVRAIADAVDTLPGLRPGITEADRDVLTLLARAVRDTVQVRFAYVSRGGDETERACEPYRLVATGRRWYLIAWDLVRSDWRTFRLDRMREPHATTFRFTPREAPDAAEFVQRAITQGTYEQTGVVRFAAEASAVREHLPATAGEVVELDGGGCEVRVGAWDLDGMSWYLARIALAVDAQVEVVSPPELADAFSRLAAVLPR